MVSYSRFFKGLSIPAFQTNWFIRVSKKYSLPEYYPGQVVFHVMLAPGGYIAHPVEVVGLIWNGIDWDYWIELPPDHQRYNEEDSCQMEVDSSNLEPM
jgi:hypothetical protein